MEMGNVSDVSEILAASETSATVPTSTWCKTPKAESTSTMNPHDNLNSVMAE
jgi:hypothetical protein